MVSFFLAYSKTTIVLRENAFCVEPDGILGYSALELVEVHKKEGAFAQRTHNRVAKLHLSCKEFNLVVQQQRREIPTNGFEAQACCFCQCNGSLPNRELFGSKKLKQQSTSKKPLSEISLSIACHSTKDETIQKVARVSYVALCHYPSISIFSSIPF